MIFSHKFCMACCAVLLMLRPAHAQERQWQLDAADHDVFLIFGVAETNDVGVSFWCKIGSQALSVFTIVPPGAAQIATNVAFELKINDKAYLLAGKVSQGDRQLSLEAPLEPRNRIWNDLKQAERFSLRIGDHVSTYPLSNADLDGLLKLCEQPPEQQ